MHFVLRHQFLLKLTLSEHGVEWAVVGGVAVEMNHYSHLSGDTFNEQQQQKEEMPPQPLGLINLLIGLDFAI